MKDDPALEAPPRELLALPAEAYVDAVIERLELEGVPARDRRALAQSIQRGVNKLRVWSALSARRRGAPTPPPPTPPTAILRPDDEIGVAEVMAEVSPGDDGVFVTYAFARLVGRDPQMHERLALLGLLKDGGLDRVGVIGRMVEIARADGRDPVVARMGARQAFALVDRDRDTRLVLLRRLIDGQLLMAEGGLAGAARSVAGGVRLEPGLAFSAPKRSLRAGRWRLMVDLEQPETSVLAFEVTANGGAETLFTATLSGAIRLGAEIVVRPDHLVVDTLVFAIRDDGADGREWLIDPREISLAWVGE